MTRPVINWSGDLGVLPAPLRVAIRAAARLAARLVEASVAPVHDFIDSPPSADQQRRAVRCRGPSCR
jgi:hypothetical protein